MDLAEAKTRVMGILLEQGVRLPRLLPNVLGQSPVRRRNRGVRNEFIAR